MTSLGEASSSSNSTSNNNQAHASTSAAASQPTLLRIRRRKRDDHETLDALVIEDGKQSNRPYKRSRGLDSRDGDASPSNPAPSKGIFRFAATVPESTFTSEDSKRTLRDRVTSLMLHPPPRQSTSSSSTFPARPSTPSTSSLRNSPSSSSLLGSGRRSKLSAPASPSSARSSNANLLQIQEKARRHARYRIVQEKRSISTSQASKVIKRNTHEEFPPTIRLTSKASATSSSSSPIPTDDFKILEAAVESDSASEGENDPISRKLKAFSQRKKKQGTLRGPPYKSSFSSLSREIPLPKDIPAATTEDDEMMMNFVAMLQEYLSLNRPSTPQNSTPPDGFNDVSPPHPGFEAAPDLSSGDAADSDSEYVYDVYYRDVEGASALAGISSGEGVDVGGIGGFGKIAALTGLDEDEILLGEGEGEEDSDAANTEDEDSNEEDFYRNDYPEGDEDASSGQSGTDMSDSDADYDDD